MIQQIQLHLKLFIYKAKLVNQKDKIYITNKNNGFTSKTQGAITVTIVARKIVVLAL